MPAAASEFVIQVHGLVAKLRPTPGFLQHPGPAGARDQSRRKSSDAHAGQLAELVIGRERRIRLLRLAMNPRQTSERPGAHLRVVVGSERRVHLSSCREILARELGLFRRDERRGRGRDRLPWLQDLFRVVQQASARPNRNPRRTGRDDHDAGWRLGRPGRRRVELAFEIGQRTLHDGGRAVRRLFQALLVALHLQGPVLFHQEPGQPAQGARGYDGNAQKYRQDVTGRAKPFTKRHGGRSRKTQKDYASYASCQARISGICQDCVSR